MLQNGALIFTVSALALWMIARGYGKNLPGAWNFLTGASSQNSNSTQPFQSVGVVPQSSGGIGWGTQGPFAPTSGGGGFGPDAYSYTGGGVSYA